MKDNIFKFKQFEVNQSRCAMKIGTDSVLLGSWIASSPQTNSILDIGAGTGVLSLMMAQKTAAEIIDGIEVDNDAYEQCVENFENSEWGDRLFCYHASFNEFVEEIDELYDLIITNPPFFDTHFKSGDLQRDTARFNDALPYQELIYGVSKLLSNEGKFNIIIPYNQKELIIGLCKEFDLNPSRILNVKGNPSSPFKRCLIELCRKEVFVKEESLTIETSRHVYTNDYKSLTKDFYLNM